ncbi:hypothetical protein [Burkholderia sp. Leaf177]|uniref:hypothetical protein n=1 Tax=Burkholderia sp. Leaf177 TaxID=1736287 RepID=UPI000AA29512|nr:hypothetical protein [Burkholderia sp. Leaf177]
MSDIFLGVAEGSSRKRAFSERFALGGVGRGIERVDASTTLWLIVRGKYWKAPPIKIKNKWRGFN